METKAIIKSQYWASMAMLRQAIEKCPETLWVDASYKDPFWNIAYHAIFFVHFYLQPTEQAFTPWEKHRNEVVGMKETDETIEPYSKEELLTYLDLCQSEMEEQVDALDLEADSGFHWLPFNKLELQLYNIRHLMLHTGELCERLGSRGEIEVAWVGMKR